MAYMSGVPQMLLRWMSVLLVVAGVRAGPGDTLAMLQEAVTSVRYEDQVPVRIFTIQSKPPVGY